MGYQYFSERIFMENLFSALFSPHGRMARLPYFGYSVLVLIAFIAVFSVMAFGIATGPELVVTLGINTIMVAGAVALYSSIVLSMKRLRDLGVSGLHVIWIYGLSLAACATNGVGRDHGIMLSLSLASLVASLWLLLAHGRKDDKADLGAPSQDQ
jgi:uncharacterized membrane protein YhaH (DUF805 family)